MLTALTEPTKRTKPGSRMIEYAWKLDTNGNVDKLAVLTIMHHKRAWNRAEDTFSVTLRNVTEEHDPNGWTSRTFMVFDGVRLPYRPAGTRYSATKLDQAAALALDELIGLYESGDESVLATFAAV